MARHLRDFLHTINKILQEQPPVWVEKEIPISRIIHPQFQKNQFVVMNSLTEDLHNLYHNPYKVKSFLQVVNSRLAKINAFSSKYKIRPIFYSVLGLGIGWGFAYTFAKIYDIQHGKFPKDLTEKSTSGLRYVVSKFVLYNDRIINETAKLVHMLCNKERIQYITMHALSRLFDLKPLVESTDKLTKEFVHNNIMHDEAIRNKLKQIIINQLRDENRRGDLLKLVLNFMKTEQAKDLFTDSIVGTLSSPEVKRETVKALLSFVYGKLDDPVTKEDMKNKINAYLSN